MLRPEEYATPFLHEAQK